MTRKYDTYAIPRSVSVCPPAVRLVAIEAWSNEGNAEHTIHPVLALETRVEAVFCRHHKPKDYRRPTTPDMAEAEGWSHESTGTHYSVVVMTGEFGICNEAVAFSGSNVAYRIVSAPWPAEEDSIRLAGVVAEVKVEAVEKEAQSDRSRTDGNRVPTLA